MTTALLDPPDRQRRCTHNQSADLGPCKEWQGRRNRRGYGLAPRRFGTNLAHRIAWIEAHGPLPSTTALLHRCDNPPCTELTHLQPGTQAENVADCVAKGRLMTAANMAARTANRKLSDEQISAIRAAYAVGDTSTTRLANQYGVSRTYVHKVVAGKRRTS